MATQAQPKSSRSRSSWNVRRPRDGKLRRPKRSNRMVWFLLLAGLVAATCWAWPQSAVQRYRYPLLYSKLVLRESQRTHLPPSLVAAVILQESDFRVRAASPVGAQGLMQLMPDTGNWVHQHLEERTGSPDLLEPETNVRLGSTYLSYLAERFDGQEVAFLAAYNAGPQQTLEWMGQAQSTTLRLSDIRFAETRAYVEAVLDSERMYRQLYPELAGG